MNNETTPAAAAPAVTAPTPDVPAPRSGGPSVRQLVVVVVILAATVVLTALTSDVNQALEPGIRLVDGQPYLPDSVGGWQGGELQGLTKEERELLPADTEGARRIYRQNGVEIVCAIVLAGRDVTSIHRPEVCLPGQGWDIENARTAKIPTPGGAQSELEVMRLDTKRLLPTAEKRSAILRSIFVYWFVGKDKTTPHHWKRIFWTARDRVLQGRNHRWAYILIHTPVGVETERPLGPESSRQAMDQVGRFVQEIAPLVKGP